MASKDVQAREKALSTQQRVGPLVDRTGTLESQVAALETQVAGLLTLQSQINAINSKLAAAHAITIGTQTMSSASSVADAAKESVTQGAFNNVVSRINQITSAL